VGPGGGIPNVGIGGAHVGGLGGLGGLGGIGGGVGGGMH